MPIVRHSLSVLLAILVGGCLKVSAVPLQVTIAVSSTGSCLLENRPIECGRVASELKNMNAVEQTRVLLDPDTHAPADPVIALLSALEAAGFRNVTFAAQTGHNSL